MWWKQNKITNKTESDAAICADRLLYKGHSCANLVRWTGVVDRFGSIFWIDFLIVFVREFHLSSIIFSDDSKMSSSSKSVSTTYDSDASTDTNANSSGSNSSKREAQQLSGVNDSGFVTREQNGSDAELISSTSASGNELSPTPDLSFSSSGSSSSVSVI